MPSFEQVPRNLIDTDGNVFSPKYLGDILEAFYPSNTINVDNPRDASLEINALIFDAKRLVRYLPIGGLHEVVDFGKKGLDAPGQSVRIEHPYYRASSTAKIVGEGHIDSDAGGVVMELKEAVFLGYDPEEQKNNRFKPTDRYHDIFRYVYLGTDIVDIHEGLHIQYVRDLGNNPRLLRVGGGEFMFSGRLNDSVDTFDGNEFFEKIVTDPNFEPLSHSFYKTACVLKDLVAIHRVS